MANIAEDAGEFSPAEKARFHRMTRRSAIEVVAWLEIIDHRKEDPDEALREALGHLERVVSMLVELIRARTR